MPTTPPAAVSFREAFWFWLRLGLISFGGPAGQIAIMHEELVEKRRWLSEKRFLHALNFCMVLPGPEAQQLATYIGWLLHRRLGGLVAGGLFVLPAFLLFLLLGWLYMVYGQLPAVAAGLYGIRPAVVAIVLAAALRIGNKALKNGLLWGVALASLLAVAVFQVGFPWIVGAAALTGAVGGRLWPQHFVIGGSQSAGAAAAPALIDDDTPVPEHARFSVSRMLSVLLAALAIWGSVMGLLAARFGMAASFTRMGWFFTKAALLTFGGAYAVLPYVFQGAVVDQHWLTPAQMLDGLALGETTPGPLLMVLTFVGFVGGWTHGLLLSPLASALLEDTLVTFMTFLPSFVFIFLGGPLVEASRRELRLTAPLSAITAAVVGVIANLGVFLGRQVFWPTQGFDGIALVLALLAFIAIQRFKLGLPALIAGAALAGWLLHAAGLLAGPG